jgi:hypothetical protein
MLRKVKNEYRSLFMECEGMRLLGRQRYRLKDNTATDLKETE